MKLVWITVIKKKKIPAPSNKRKSWCVIQKGKESLHSSHNDEKLMVCIQNAVLRCIHLQYQVMFRYNYFIFASLHLKQKKMWHSELFRTRMKIVSTYELTHTNTFVYICCRPETVTLWQMKKKREGKMRAKTYERKRSKRKGVKKKNDLNVSKWAIEEMLEFVYTSRIFHDYVDFMHIARLGSVSVMVDVCVCVLYVCVCIMGAFACKWKLMCNGIPCTQKKK